MGNFDIIEIILLAVIGFAAFSKRLDSKQRNMLLLAAGGLFLVIMLTGGGSTPGTPLSILFGGSNFTNILVIAAVAFYLIRNRDSENPTNFKPIMIGLLVYFFFSAASAPSTL